MEVIYTSDGLIKLWEWCEILHVILRFIQFAVWNDRVNTLERAELIVLSTSPTEVLWHALYLDTLCIVLCIACVHCFTEQGWLILLCPPDAFLCHLWRCVGVFMAPFLPSTPPASIRSLFSISIFLLNLSFRPVQTVCLCWPLTLSITPAIMRLNLSASTGHTGARASAHAHTRYHPLKKAHYSFSHALNQHKPDAIMQLAHLALLQTPHTHSLMHSHLACAQDASL